METKGVPYAPHVAGMIDDTCFQLLARKIGIDNKKNNYKKNIIVNIVFLKFAKMILTPVIIKAHIAV